MNNVVVVDRMMVLLLSLWRGYSQYHWRLRSATTAPWPCDQLYGTHNVGTYAVT